MKDQNSILFKQSNLYIKSTIELPPSLVFSKSIFLTQYFQNYSSESLLIPIVNIIQSSINLHRTIKLNSYSSFANNQYYILYYRYLVNLYKDYNSNSIGAHTAYSIINYINFNIYLLLALLTGPAYKFTSNWYSKTLYFNDSVIKKLESSHHLATQINLLLNPLILKLDSPQIFITYTNKSIDKFSLTIMQQNDNKK